MPSASDVATILKKQKARRSQAVGASAQRLVVNTLIGMGLRHVVEIPTRMRKIRGKWMHAARAEGDIRAVAPMGRSFLCEVKWRAGDVLCYSDLEGHQHRNLTDHHDAGGWSAVAWCGPHGVRVMSWSTLLALGFKPGTSIDQDKARLAEVQL